MLILLEFVAKIVLFVNMTIKQNWWWTDPFKLNVILNGENIRCVVWRLVLIV